MIGPIGMSEEKDEAQMAREQALADAGHHQGGAEEVEGIIPQMRATPGMPDRQAVHRRRENPAVTLMAKVIHGADVAEDSSVTAQSPGLLAIADGFAMLDVDDQRQLELELPVYDALYAWAKAEVGAGRT